MDFSPPIIPAGKPFFDKAIEYDKEVSRPHFLYLKLRSSRFAIDPVVGKYVIAIAPNDCFKRELDRKIEMVTQKRFCPLDYPSVIELERICDVVIAKPKQNLNKLIGKPIQYELQ